MTKATIETFGGNENFLVLLPGFSTRFQQKGEVHKWWEYKPKLKGGGGKFCSFPSKTLHILQSLN